MLGVAQHHDHPPSSIVSAVIHNAPLALLSNCLQWRTSHLVIRGVSWSPTNPTTTWAVLLEGVLLLKLLIQASSWMSHKRYPKAKEDPKHVTLTGSPRCPGSR